MSTTSQGLANFLRKGPDSKCFSLCGPDDLCHSALRHPGNHRQYYPNSPCVPIKLSLHKQVGVRFGPQARVCQPLVHNIITLGNEKTSSLLPPFPPNRLYRCLCEN